MEDSPGTNNEMIDISNAGLVITHPFLPDLFKRLNLINDNGWVNERSQHTGAFILEYLNRGNDEYLVPDLSLNKLLCNIDINDALAPGIMINEGMKTECEYLLTEIIHQWSILQNSTTAALRESFFQRNGKLTKVAVGWELVVESRTIDVLLNRLPWGISLIKLPWLKEMIHVEWSEE